MRHFRSMPDARHDVGDASEHSLFSEICTAGVSERCAPACRVARRDCGVGDRRVWHQAQQRQCLVQAECLARVATLCELPHELGQRWEAGAEARAQALHDVGRLRKRAACRPQLQLESARPKPHVSARFSVRQVRRQHVGRQNRSKCAGTGVSRQLSGALRACRGRCARAHVFDGGALARTWRPRRPPAL